MRYFAIIISSLFLLVGCSNNTSPIDYVNPLIGTGYHGHTYPGATTPFGMVQLSPDTRVGGWDACSGYHYSDNTILGFSHTHLNGTGVADLSDILFYPTTKLLTKDSIELYQRPAHIFSHNDEKVIPGYYSVAFSDEDIFVELTATPRTGMHRYIFKGDGKRQVLVDLMHSVGEENVKETSLRQVRDTEIVGMRLTDGWVLDHYVYFSARFSEPIKNIEIVSDKQALLTFDDALDSLTIAVSLSSVNEANAQENGVNEVPVLDFDKVYSDAKAMWIEAMSDIEVFGGTNDQKVNFYTAQYHTKLTPNLMNDVNGEYRRHDNTIAKVKEGEKYYSTFSLWDTFRSWHPLQTIVDTTLVRDMVASLLEMYDASGELPLWPLASGETNTMIGYHSISVIADAYLKGLVTFDAEKALEAMVKSSIINKKGSSDYIDYGYIPANFKKESVSITLEFCYDDWAIAKMAEAMGKTEIANEYYQRAKSYINLFDGSTCFFRGKNDDGSFTASFDPSSTSREFTEATPWHYRFFVPHDIYGQEQLFGSNEAYVDALDDLFTLEPDLSKIELSDVTGLKGQYAHGNEPSHHMAYLYSYIGQPWKTQKMTRMLLDEMYRPVPEGIIGNEDCGQMSAWYIMSALGFYSVCPGTNEFVMTTPLFDAAKIKLANGKTLTIKADNPKKNLYIKDVLLNGVNLNAEFITYNQIMSGGELHFVLDPKPYKEKAATNAKPYSMTKEKKVSSPYTTSKINLFVDKLDLNLLTTTEGADIRYTLDGSEPTMSSTLYNAPVELKESKVIKVKAYKEGYEPSETIILKPEKAVFEKGINKGTRANGVNYAYCKGVFSSVSQVAKTSCIERGVMPTPNIENAPDIDHYAYIFNGYIDIQEDGIWEFMTKSDDGSVLYINDKVVVNNDGSHSAIMNTGRVALQKGLHPYTLIYFEDYEGQELSWGWKKTGQEKFENIPSTSLYR